MSKDINRLKVVLAEKKRTNKWLAEQLGKDPATVSKWCTNTIQPNVETLVEIAKCLNVEIQDLFWPIENIAINDLSEEHGRHQADSVRGRLGPG